MGQPFEELLNIGARGAIEALEIHASGNQCLHLRPALEEPVMPAFSKAAVASGGVEGGLGELTKAAVC